jgi:hypothetical protein
MMMGDESKVEGMSSSFFRAIEAYMVVNFRTREIIEVHIIGVEHLYQ